MSSLSPISFIPSCIDNDNDIDLHDMTTVLSCQMQVLLSTFMDSNEFAYKVPFNNQPLPIHTSLPNYLVSNQVKLKLKLNLKPEPLLLNLVLRHQLITQVVVALRLPVSSMLFWLHKHPLSNSKRQMSLRGPSNPTHPRWSLNLTRQITEEHFSFQ